MTLHRFFVPSEALGDDLVRLSGETAHQIRNVLRKKPGDRIIVLDDSQTEREVELTQVNAGQVTGRVVHQTPSKREANVQVTLYQAVLKARKFEWVLQKGTELGVAEFIPVVCDRSLVGDLQDVDRKRDRWQKIIQEAAEQSRRARLPGLQSPMLYPAACQRVADEKGLSLLLWEDEQSVTLKHVLGDYRRSAPASPAINLFVGPEGGFSEEEIQIASRYQIPTVSLGPRILRAETAGLAAAAAVFYEWQDET